MRHKIYLLIFSLIFLLGMVGLQSCFEDHYAGPRYGYGGYRASRGYVYAPPYRAYNSYGSRDGNGYRYRERHEDYAGHQGWGYLHESHNHG
jgi:hypothetical protein